jgi:hypothetical protein
MMKTTRDPGAMFGVICSGLACLIALAAILAGSLHGQTSGPRLISTASDLEGDPLLAGPMADKAVQKRIESLLANCMKIGPKADEPTADRLVGCGKGTAPFLAFLLSKRNHAKLPLRAMGLAIGRRAGADAIPTLARLLASKQARARVAGVVGLDAVARRKCLEPLASVAADSDRTVRLQAAHALKSLALRYSRLDVCAALMKQIGSAAYKPHLTMLMGDIGGYKAHRYLWRLMRSSRPETKLAAMEGLIRLRKPQDGPEVAKLLHERSGQLKRRACIFLGTVRHKASVRALIDQLSSDDAGLCKNAGWALRQITRLGLRPEPQLWEDWWERTGRKQKEWREA